MASPFSKFALFTSLALAGCTGAAEDQLTLATSASDAVVMSTAVGTWVGTTPDGPVTLTICEDPARLVDVPALPDALRCPEIAHEVRGVGRSPAEMVDLTPQEETSDDFFQGETTRTCDRVMAAPLAMRLESWCAPAVVHGALVLADRPVADPTWARGSSRSRRRKPWDRGSFSARSRRRARCAPSTRQGSTARRRRARRTIRTPGTASRGTARCRGRRRWWSSSTAAGRRNARSESDGNSRSRDRPGASSYAVGDEVMADSTGEEKNGGARLSARLSRKRWGETRWHPRRRGSLRSLPRWACRRGHRG